MGELKKREETVIEIYDFVTKFLKQDIFLTKTLKKDNKSIIFAALGILTVTIFVVSCIAFLLFRTNFIHILTETSIKYILSTIYFVPFFIVIFFGARNEIENAICKAIYFCSWHICILFTIPFIVFIFYLKTEINSIFYVHLVMLLLAVKYILFIGILFFDKAKIKYKLSKIYYIILLLLACFQGGISTIYLISTGKMYYDPIFNELITQKVPEKSKTIYFFENYNLFLHAFGNYIETKDLFFYLFAQEQGKLLIAEKDNLEKFRKTLIYNQSKKIVAYELEGIDFIENTLTQLERLQNIPSNLSERCDSLYNEIKINSLSLESKNVELQSLGKRIDNLASNTKNISNISIENINKISLYQEELDNIKAKMDEIFVIAKNHESKIETYRNEILKISLYIDIGENTTNELRKLLTKNNNMLLQIKDYYNDLIKIIKRKQRFLY